MRLSFPDCYEIQACDCCGRDFDHEALNGYLLCLECEAEADAADRAADEAFERDNADYAARRAAA